MKKQNGTNGLGIASMVVGIISVLLSCCGAGGFLGVIGLGLGIAGLAMKNKEKVMAIVGTTLSGLAIIAAIFTVSNGTLSDYIEKSKESQSTATEAGGSTAVDATTEAATEEDIIDISAEDLCVAYDSNEVNCKNTYEGKTLRVTGVIYDIGIDILDDQYVILYGGSYDQTYVTLHCTVSKDTDISALEKGATITLVGEYADNPINPELKRCTIE